MVMLIHKSYIGPGTASKLRRLGVRRSWNRDQTLFSTLDMGEEAVFVEQGTARVSLLSANGLEKTLGFVHPGTLIGETALFDDDAHTPQVDLAAVAVSDTVIAYHISKGDFVQLLRDDPDFALELVRIEALKVRGLLAQLQLLAFSKSEGLVAGTLLALQEGLVVEASTQVVAEVTQEALGRLTGQTRMTVSRALKALAQRGAVKVSRKRVFIVDEDLLRSMTN